MSDRVTVWCAPDGTVAHWMIKGYVCTRKYGAACTWPRTVPTHGYRTRRRKAGIYFLCPNCRRLWNQWLDDPVYIFKEMFDDRRPLA